MADTKLETIEPDPSATAISNDLSVNAETVLQDSNPTADANSKVENDLPSTDDVDKVIAEVESRRKQKEEASGKEPSKEVAVETNGHETSENKNADVDAKREPSERVKEGQNWNNRDRNRDHNSKPKKNFQDYKKNYKSDLTSQQESSDPVAIRKQVGEHAFF